MALPLKAQEPESLYGTSHDRALDSVLYSMKKRRPVTSLDTKANHQEWAGRFHTAMDTRSYDNKPR